MTGRRVYLVTGASSGIGFEATRTLLRRGHVVYGAARRTQLMAPLVEAGGHALRMDVTDADSVAGAVSTIVGEQGRIDGVVADAGYAQLGTIENVTIDDAMRQFDVNVLGVTRVVQAVLPTMRAQGRGTIVVVSSIAARTAVPGMVWYAASKHALEAFADALRMEVGRFGIRVAIVQPDFARTGLLEASLPTLDAAGRAPHAGVYEREQAHFRARFRDSVLRGTPAEEVGRVVAEALERDAPKRRYAPTIVARLKLLLMRHLGDGLLNRILGRMWLGKGSHGQAPAGRATSRLAGVDVGSDRGDRPPSG